MFQGILDGFRYLAVNSVLLLKIILLFLIFSCGEDKEPDSVSDKSEYERGRRLYMSNGCPVCHGNEGRGDGRIAGSLHPPPLDFRDLMSYKKGAELEQLAKTIGVGITGSSMPGFSHLTATDRLEIAKFILYLQKIPDLSSQ